MTAQAPQPTRRHREYTVEYRGDGAKRRAQVRANDADEALRIAIRRHPGSHHQIIGRHL